MLNCDDETLCRLCFNKQAAPNSVFCADCDRRPRALDASSCTKNESTVKLFDDDGNVLYEAEVPAGTNVHAVARDMFAALKQKNYPLITLTFLKNESEE